MIEKNKPSLLVIVRHGESMSNEKKENGFVPAFIKDEFINLSAQNVPITTKGKHQSMVTGDNIKNKYGLFDYIYSSPFVRTRETTKGLISPYNELEKAKMQYRENVFIRERDAGYGFAMTKEENERHFPWLRQYWDVHGNFYATPPGGESMANVVQRVHLFIGTLLRRRVGQKILIVTHGGTIRCFRYILEHWTPEQAEDYNGEGAPVNCGVTTYTVNEQNKFVLQQYNKKYW